MSTAPFEDDRASPAETVAGFLAALSLTASAIALVYRPVRLAPFALLVAFIAAGAREGPPPKARRRRSRRRDDRLARGHGHRGDLEQPILASLP